MVLNVGQQGVEDDILSKIECKQGGFLLIDGEAGVGKTYTVLSALKKAIGLNFLTSDDVIVSAPTHTLKDRWQYELIEQGTGILATTPHSLLQFFPATNDKGETYLCPAPNTQATGATVPFRVVVVDECHSVPSILVQTMYAYASILWVMMGDEAQMPPVGESESSLKQLVTDFAAKHTLTEQMRQKCGTLASLVQQVKAEGRLYQPRIANTLRAGKFQSKLMDYIDESIEKQDYDLVRYIAFHNLACQRMSNQIREYAYGLRDFTYAVVGEKLVVKSLCTKGGSRLIQSNSVVEVVETLDDKSGFFVLHKGIEIFCPIDRSEETQKARELAEKAGTSQEWAKANKVRDSFVRYRCPWVSTVHGTQGSTYNRVFVDWPDLLACRGAKQMFYTAVGRAKEEVWFKG